MKKVFVASIMVLLLTAACKQAPTVPPVDIKAEEVAVNSLLDKFSSAIRDVDVETLTASFTDNLVFLGTDPSELWNKQQITDRWSGMVGGTPNEAIIIGERVVRISADGLSAIAVDQYYMPRYSEKIAFRNMYHLVKISDGWLIDFLNVSFVPKNEDIPKLNKALE
jgi:hypothetical protein